MLGRYIAGTVLVLGAAMMVAPDRAEKPADVDVTRSETAPAALATADPAALANAARSGTEPAATAPVQHAARSEPAPVGQEAGIEAALAQALALDQTENSADAQAAPLADVAAGAGSAAPEAAEEIETTRAFAGLTLDLDAPQAGRIALDDGISLAALATGTQEATPSDTAEPAARILFVTGSSVNVRSGPSTQYRVVDRVTQGQPVELVAFEGQNWARIRLGDGETTGYMSRKFLASEAAGG